MIKGRRLANLKGVTIRPTSDIVRGAIFDILGQTLTDLRVLDLFAGTGSLGIESLSRGAKKAVFVDSSYRAIAIIKEAASYGGAVSGLVPDVVCQKLKEKFGFQ